MQQRKTLPVKRNNAARDVRRGYPRGLAGAVLVRACGAGQESVWSGAGRGIMSPTRSRAATSS